MEKLSCLRKCIFFVFSETKNTNSNNEKQNYCVNRKKEDQILENTYLKHVCQE